ncbi:hypothetical protein ONS95_013499 [Cadophora gregata]|uniref:uncharacterized protein n=1 Tax=Cadophora gregata TaxID=51156 RepID=UPI0026DBC134|nr:uncharacterized protein ONS95_013499 [Cadophora gregata]KAK0099604.1 hypothetical protein ONS96_008104 [Cadophora gregata f. sp. sojae]KAK0116485.1 hypothetical protein ONS95_013499 [Cadophora gregata]
MIQSRVKSIIFDIGDVICSWSPPADLAIQPKLLKEFRASTIWHEYNRGCIGQDECYSRLACRYGVSAKDITTAFDMARESQEQNNNVVATIKELKASHPDLCIYAMSNISKPDWEILHSKAFDWDIFDRVFTSCDAGMCKPELRFYRHVLAQTKATACQTVFVDDKAENILAAKSVGFHEAIVFDTAENVRRKLLSLLGDPITRGREWLCGHATKLYSETSTGVMVQDNFGQLLTYEVTRDMSLMNLKYSDQSWNYFIGSPFGTDQVYPDDVDTTSCAFKLLPLSSVTAQSIMDKMVSPEMKTPDGIVKVYFDKNRDRTDPAVCINVVRMFYQYGRGMDSDLQATKDWIQDVLFYRAYSSGTRYYQQPDVFLYFFARLLLENPHSDIHRNTASLLRERLKERINTEADSMGLAMRILACHFVGLRDEADLQRLLKTQLADGSFEIGWLCQYGKSKVKLGHQGLTTALAVAAIQAVRGPN